MNPLKYFDLNFRFQSNTKANREQVSGFRKGLWRKSPRASSKASAHHPNLFVQCWKLLTYRDEGKISVAEQILLYLGILLGVCCSSMMRTQEVRPSFFLAALIALLVMPIAFEKLDVNPTAPLFVRFALFTQNGMFWDILLQAIGRK